MPTFQGFPKEAVTFYKELACYNKKEWFEAHKADYKKYVLIPAQQFVIAMGERLRTLSPNVTFDTRTNGAGSIFRIYRDTRFSPDKTPYKAFLGIYFWEGNRSKTENSGYYFHLEPEKLMLGVGIYIFIPSLLKIYRDAVVHPKQGKAFSEAIKRVTTAGPYHLGGAHFKKVPRGYDASHPNAEFLLYNGLYAGIESEIPQELYSSALLEYCFERFRDMNPPHRWLVNILSSSTGLKTDNL